MNTDIVARFNALLESDATRGFIDLVNTPDGFETQLLTERLLRDWEEEAGLRRVGFTKAERQERTKMCQRRHRTLLAQRHGCARK